MNRKDGWELRLEEVFARYRAEPFDWSKHNCVTFTGDAFRAMTGGHTIAYPADARPPSATEAARILASLGGLEAAVTSVLGAPATDWRSCRRGDIALIEQEGRAALAVCTGRTVCAPGPHGLVHLPVKSARLVWHVG